MRKQRAILVMGLGFCSAMSSVVAASAEMTSPPTRAAIIRYLKGLD